MNPIAELDNLPLNATVKKAVESIIASLLAQDQAVIAQQKTEIYAKDLKIQLLTQQIAVARRWRFGQKSEGLTGHQKDIFIEDNEADLAALESELQALVDTTPKTTVARVKKSPIGRQTLPMHLPRIECRHELESCECGQCGQMMVKIGEDKTERLDIIPAKFQVLVDIYPKYACKPCEIITAQPVAPSLIEGGLATVNLLSWVIISKYFDHLPLYRLEQIAARDKVNLSRSTLSRWVGMVGFELRTLRKASLAS